MIRTRLALLLGVCISALGQSVVSTHSGIVYFFDGSVSIGEQRLEQKFGKFPDIGEGGELRTAHGRAEVLLTPGVILRVAENSAIRMISTAFSDTRVELLSGSAILEADEPDAKGAVRLIRKNWEVKIPHEGAFRLDSEPSQVTVYQGEADVSVAGEQSAVTVKVGETLPLAEVLVAEDTPHTASDEFKNWAMSRSEAVSSDNATAKGIMDDPTEIENATGAADLAGFSYFPLTGIPGLTVTNPYGASFWSPFQPALSSTYFSPYTYGLLYSTGWPSAFRYPLWRSTGLSRWTPIGLSTRPIGTSPTSVGRIGLPAPHSTPHFTPPPAIVRPPSPRPVTAPPHVGVHPIGHK
jgi:hypothetical protein